MAPFYDVTIIGAGVVGCAMARRFTLEGAKVLVLEKGTDILDGASKGNSAILHTGFDEPSDFLELQCIRAGYREFMAIHEQLNLPVLRSGALVVAWTAGQASKLEQLAIRAASNGVQVQLLSDTEIAGLEPHLSERARAGFRVPGEYVIDPWTTPFVYLLQAIRNGATVQRATAVTGGRFDGTDWLLRTSHKPVRTATVINCAGLYGDRVDQRLLGKALFQIRPRKGQFLVYDKSARELLSSIVLPVPSDTTKGVVVTPTIFGNLLVGPTAEEQDNRDEAAVERDTLLALKEQGEAILPGLAHCPVTASYAGLRPATESRDYRIACLADRNYVSVGGIRSTGLSSALGIASHVYGLYSGSGRSHTPPPACSWPTVSSLAEHGERDWQRPDNGGVVCHCELVTRREIEQALSGPLAAASLAGLKRRTRATMGRCQGFYCSARLSELTAGRFVEPIGIASVRNR